MANIDVFVGR